MREAGRVNMCVTGERDSLCPAHALWGAGLVQWKLGHLYAAEKVLQDGLQEARSMGDVFMEALCMEALAWVAESMENPTRAAMLLSASSSLVRAAGSVMPGAGAEAQHACRVPTDGADGQDGVLAKLTPREREVAGLVAEGLSNRSIADRLFISQRTVDGHVEHILAKRGFRSRAQIAYWLASRQIA